jgi:hypothetical protein
MNVSQGITFQNLLVAKVHPQIEALLWVEATCGTAPVSRDDVGL